MVSVKLINQDSAKDAGLAIVTLDEGKTLADLEAWGSVDPPPWVQILGFSGINNPGKDTVQNIEATDKPLYFVCFEYFPEEIIGRFGPIEIKK